jgi:hypothetical protein
MSLLHSKCNHSRKELDEVVWVYRHGRTYAKEQWNECNSHNRVLQYNFTIKWQFSYLCCLHSSHKLSSITSRREGGRSHSLPLLWWDSWRGWLVVWGGGCTPNTQFFHLSEWQALYIFLRVYSFEIALPHCITFLVCHGSRPCVI